MALLAVATTTITLAQTVTRTTTGSTTQTSTFSATLPAYDHCFCGTRELEVSTPSCLPLLVYPSSAIASRPRT